MANERFDLSSSQFMEMMRIGERGFYRGVGVDAISNALNDNNASLQNYLYYNSLSAGMNYSGTRNEGSSIDQVMQSSIELTGLNLANMYLNSNAPVTDTGKVCLTKGAVKATAGATAGSFKLSPLTASSATSIVFSEIPAAIAAVGVGTQLGVGMDGTAYNVMKALDLNPPYYLNPNNWKNICKEDNSLGMQTLRWLVGINTDDETVQGYITQEAAANIAFWQHQQGWYDDSYNAEIDADPDVVSTIDPDGRIFYPPRVTNQLQLQSVNGDHCVLFTTANIGLYVIELSNNPPDAILRYPELGPRRIYAVGTEPFTVTVSLNGGNPRQEASRSATATDPYTGMTYSFYYINDIGTGLTAQMQSSSLPYRMNTSTFVDAINRILVLYYKYGRYVPAGDRPDGISSQPGAKLPDTSTWDTPEDVLLYLQQNYPEYFDPTYNNTQAISVPTIQPDGSIEDIIYVPIGFAQPQYIYNDNSTTYTLNTVGTQGDTAIDTKASDSQLTNELLKCILNEINSLDPNISLEANFIIEEKEDEEEEEEEEEEPKPEDIIQIGSGKTSPQVKQITAPCSLFRVYNPSDYSVNAFGNWLWDDSIMAVLRNLVTDPLTAILTLHKIYVKPEITTHSNITVAKLDSGISSAVVSNLYTEFDFGTIVLSERYNNVFDYPPYTSVQIYLPFIGIVPLNVVDVMRASLNLKYKVDVSTGVFVAQLKVVRDMFPEYDSINDEYVQTEAGGELYQWSGNMSVEYPISGADYRNLYRAILSATTLVTGFSSGLVAGAGAVGEAASGTLMGLSTASGFANTLLGGGGNTALLSPDLIQISRSGNLTGNAGALANKEAYLIITRPQTAMDAQDDQFHGIPSNEIVTLSECSGFTSVKEVRLRLEGAFEAEYNMVESLLKTGVILG